MGDRQAQEFWDQMWYWERYELFPGETIPDPFLPIVLGSQIERARDQGQEPDPEVVTRFNHAVGRVLNRLTNLFPRTGEEVNFEELKHWLAFGLDPANRGHDGEPTPIIDANSLVIFLRFTGYAIEFCKERGLSDLQTLWEKVQEVAQEVEDEHQGEQRPSAFDVANLVA